MGPDPTEIILRFAGYTPFKEEMRQARGKIQREKHSLRRRGRKAALLRR